MWSLSHLSPYLRTRAVVAIGAMAVIGIGAICLGHVGDGILALLLGAIVYALSLWADQSAARKFRREHPGEDI